LLSGQAAQFVFRAPGGSVVTLGGIDGAALRELVDQAEHIPDDRRALFVRLRPAGSIEAYVEQVIAVLAETAIRLWPVWFTDMSFAMCCDDALGRQAAGVIAREAAARAPGVSSSWAEAAALLALAGRPPRVAGVLPAIEVAQLSVSRVGLVLVWIEGRLVVELDGYPDHATRRAFIGDRHRDYELALSGYTVLRLANDEVVQDFGRAIEKIRDLVRLRRLQMNQEG
jgi:hypothetical protein